MTSIDIGNFGEKRARTVIGGRATTHKAPFDRVTKQECWEVKTLYNRRRKRVTMNPAAYERKITWAREHGLTPMLLVIMMHNRVKVEIYECPLQQHVSISNMRRVQ